ncbi:MAG: Hsp20/alpha crystallin family protein [Planctomycetota bacterium]|jgi:HSP20 family protein
MMLIPWKKRRGECGLAHPGDLLGGDVERFFGDFFRGWPLAGQSDSFMPRLDLSETEDEVVISVELPGMDREDIDLTVSEGHLIISGEKKSETKDESRHVVESRSGKFQRAVRLGNAVDVAKAAATYRNGVLVVKIPKSEAVKPRKIEIGDE